MTTKLNSPGESNESLEKELKDIDKRILDLNDEEIVNKITKHTIESEALDGSFSQINFWKLKKSLMKSSSDPPTAKKDSGGNVITERESLKSLYIETYKLLSPF